MRPLLPFPLPIHVGADTCQISRVFRLVSQGPGRAARFIHRVLTPREREREQHRLAHQVLADAASRRPVGPTGRSSRGVSAVELRREEPEVWDVAVFLAGRFAAKEAAMKAHPHRRLTFHDIEVERRQVEGATLGSGPPVLRIKREVGGGEESHEGADESALVSISHDGDYATAVCIGHERRA